MKKLCNLPAHFSRSLRIMGLTLLSTAAVLGQKPCDTLFFRNGQAVAVDRVKHDGPVVRFHKCGDPKRKTFQTPVEQLDRVQRGSTSKTFQTSKPRAAKPQRKPPAPFRFRMGIARFSPRTDKEDNIERLKKLGFGDAYHNKTDFLLYSFSSSAAYPLYYGQSPRWSFWADAAVRGRLLVGAQYQKQSVGIQGYNQLFRTTDGLLLTDGFRDHGHAIKFNVSARLFEAKAGLTDRRQRVSAYVGPIVAALDANQRKSTKLGCWGGADLNLRGRRHGLFFWRFFGEYHWLPQVDWAAESYSELEGQKLHQSHFPGMKVNLSFFSLGIGAGLCF